MPARTLKLIVIGAALGIATILMLMPKLPPSTEQAQEQLQKEPELERIMLEMNLAEAPMEGILRLKDYADTHPESAQAQYYLGKLAVQSRQFDKAALRFESVVAIEPERADVWFELSGLHLSQRSFNRSLACAQKAHEVDPNLTDALFFEASSLEHLGDTVMALVVYEEFLPFAKDQQVRDVVEASIKELSK